MKFFLPALILAMVGCGGANTLAPSPPVVTTPISYTINVPAAAVAAELSLHYPNGVTLSPIEAQKQFDFTQTYQGVPNVYWGAAAPPQGVYQNAGIVVAPLAAASKRIFTKLDWAVCPDTCSWVGHFEAAFPGAQ